MPRPADTRLACRVVPGPADSGPEGRSTVLTLLPGALWGATLFVAFGFLITPRPETASQYAILLFLSVFVGALHAGALAAFAGLVANPRLGPGVARLADGSLALLFGVLYGWLSLSLVKFSTTHSQLRVEDIWFLATSWRQVGGEGTAMEKRVLLFSALAPLVLALAIFVLLRLARRRARPFRPAAALVLLVAGLVGLGALAWRYPAARWAASTLLPDTSATVRAWERATAPDPTAGWKPDPGIESRIEPWQPAAPPQRWNVLVVMLESVSWKRLLGPDARPGSTPRLTEFAGESIDFERAYALSTHSDYAQTSILASLFPRKGEGHDYFLDLDYPRALPWDVLAPLGWRSIVDSTQNESWGNMIAFLRTPRLETLRHAPDYPDAPHRGSGSQTKIYEQAIVDDFLRWTAAQPGRPFVAYLNFQATHYPYMWPDTFAPPFGPAPIDFPTTFLSYPTAEIPLMLDRFHNALAYVDLEFGRLIDGLRAQGLWDHTVVLVVADHGEAFYEHGLPTHGTTLLEEQVRIPMLLRLPGTEPRKISEPVSALDALPTIYRAMGLPRHGALQGRDDVLDPGYTAAARPLFFTIQGMTHEDGLLDGSWKLIVNHDRRESALFDLDTDPGERVNLVVARPELRASLTATLGRFLARQLGYYRARAWKAGWYAPRLP
jgi:lipoteichoic acid synthase